MRGGPAVAGPRTGHPFVSSIGFGAHPPPQEIDAVLVDAYPFDGSLQFAHDRALWPVKDLPDNVPVVLIAQCQRGAGTHEFFPAADPFASRIMRRVRQVRASDLLRIPEILANALALRAERQREIILLTEGIGREDARRVFPRGILCPTWESVCSLIDRKVTTTTRRIVLYSTAPLLLPLKQVK